MESVSSDSSFTGRKRHIGFEVDASTDHVKRLCIQQPDEFYRTSTEAGLFNPPAYAECSILQSTNTSYSGHYGLSTELSVSQDENPALPYQDGTGMFFSSDDLANNLCPTLVPKNFGLSLQFSATDLKMGTFMTETEVLNGDLGYVSRLSHHEPVFDKLNF
jgi:hypothetical protein